jgi:hypothetical protein
MNARKKINSFLIKNRQWFIIGGAIVLIVPLVILLLWNRENVEQMTPKEETYRYVAGVKIEYTDEMQLVREEDKTVIKDSDEVDSGSVPIFSSISYKIILPASMGYMRPFNEDPLTRVNYFATVTKKGSEMEIDNSGTIVTTSEGFLYDGKGTYIFLEDVVVTVGTTSYNISSLSYVKEIYGQSVEIYDMTNDFYKYISLVNTDAIVTSSEGYSVNVGTGVMTIGDTKRILFSDIEAMGVLQ